MDLPARFAANRARRQAVAAERTAATDELRTLIAEAFDHDMAVPDIARLAALSDARVYQLLPPRSV